MALAAKRLARKACKLTLSQTLITWSTTPNPQFPTPSCSAAWSQAQWLKATPMKVKLNSPSRLKKSKKDQWSIPAPHRSQRPQVDSTVNPAKTRGSLSKFSKDREWPSSQAAFLNNSSKVKLWIRSSKLLLQLCPLWVPQIFSKLLVLDIAARRPVSLQRDKASNCLTSSKQLASATA